MYFAGRDEQQFGRVGYVDLDAGDPTRTLALGESPILELGEPGTFDDSGVNPSCALERDGRVDLYYIGWQRAERVPYMIFSGLATECGDGANLEKRRRTPLLDRTPAEPFSRSVPFVLREADGFRAWYVCFEGWAPAAEGRMRYTAVIKHLHSRDGIVWGDEGSLCLSPHGPDEFAVGRPWVLRDESLYRMWYGIRSASRGYRLGYAESRDGLAWERKDATVGIDVSESGWDSDMLCCACVVDVDGRRLMLYNGNGFGEEGFGLAELLED